MLPLSSRVLNLRTEIATIPHSDATAPALAALVAQFIDHALNTPKNLAGKATEILKLATELCAAAHTSTAAYEQFPDLSFLLAHTLDRIKSKDDSIRARATLLLGDVIKALFTADEALASDPETINTVQNTIFPRLSDKSVSVRAAAVQAAESLQDDADDAQCEIIAQLMYLCMHDASPIVRAAAVSHIVVTTFTLPSIICRVRDTTVSVRTAALLVLKDKVDVRLMTDLQRVVTLRSGLTPRCAATYAAASTMLCTGWLKSLGFSPTNLLTLMDAANNEAVCELAIKAILKAGATGAIKKLTAAQKKAYTAARDKPADPNHLTVESTLLLRVRCEMIKEDTDLTESAKAEKLEPLIPDTPVVCATIQKHLGLHIASVRDGGDDADGDSEDSFITLQLLKLARLADFSDEAGRKQCLALLHNMLCSAMTPDELVESCIRACGVAHREEEEYLERVHAVLKEVSDYDAEDESMDANDAAFRQLRIVSIVGVVLEHTKRNLTDSKIAQLQDQILPAIMSSDDLVREAGFTCLGKYAMLGADAAEEYQSVLLSAAANETERPEIRAQALLAMSDLSMLFEGMLDETEVLDMATEETKTVSFPAVLADIINGGCGAMVVIAAEICSKLLTMGKIKSSSTLAKLLMIYFDPKVSPFVLHYTSSPLFTHVFMGLTLTTQVRALRRVHLRARRGDRRGGG